MKDPYLHKKAIQVPIYRGNLIIILSNSVEKVDDVIGGGFEGDHVYAHQLFGNYKGRQGFFIVLNFDNPNRNITHGCIAHEAHHAAMCIAWARGIKTDPDNDEPTAYLVEWIVDEIYKFMKSKGIDI